ncbi:hypothetical protein TPHA_0C05030 [Tetrapisispora phaffii CBS 4417]|uniref:Uncharacterized protein n=1 Tax=Tetrapisispora phaffii (strain ATCC 24235 / CBS 4417 / NBRC 1672 / NRRL Y-8282 / UCD 70-5) TaxID=1071381 RepID=G8BQZ0_TETPH|nr:hypothetical protein TPHA_0C05030 [Tetrapisispora phaffii CBS 4417]CCE62652.1 hypothetical protein TPHA_0C05030 [Tetrapisispora phaffii CBS 4417]
MFIWKSRKRKTEAKDPRKFDVSYTVIKCEAINELYESIVIAGDGDRWDSPLREQLKALDRFTRPNAPALLAIGNHDSNTLYVTSPFGMSKCKNKVYDRNYKTKKIDFEKLNQQIQARFLDRPLRRKTNTPKKMLDRRFADGTDHLDPIKSVEYLPLYRDDYTPIIFLKCSYENAKRTAKRLAIAKKVLDDAISLKFSPNIFYLHLEYPITFAIWRANGFIHAQLKLCRVRDPNISTAMFKYTRDRYLDELDYKLPNHWDHPEVILIEPIERTKDEGPHESIEKAPSSYDALF